MEVWKVDHKNGKWAKQILDSRNDEGMWGNFHTLSQPVSNKAITTEQAIRRLRILGYTKEDEPIQTVLERMCQCVRGEKPIDNYYEKTHDWPLFERLMLSAWIRLFDPVNETALTVARQWAFIVQKAFASGQYNKNDDMDAFALTFGRRPKPRSGFETGFGMFYHAVLLRGVLEPGTESLLLDYYLARSDGIYYIYDKCLSQLPEEFASKMTSHYLAAAEVLAEYEKARERMGFVAGWLASNRDEDGQWDLGAGAKDGVCFPLSDSWRSEACRKADCTERINKLLQKLVR